MSPSCPTEAETRKLKLNRARVSTLRPSGAGPGFGPCSLQKGPALGTVDSSRDCEATRLVGKLGGPNAGPARLSAPLPSDPRAQEVPPPRTCAGCERTPPPLTSVPGAGRFTHPGLRCSSERSLSCGSRP